MPSTPLVSVSSPEELKHFFEEEKVVVPLARLLELVSDRYSQSLGNLEC